MYSRSDDMNIRIHAMEKTGFNFKIQIQHGYRDCKHLLEYFHNLCRCSWFDKEESTIYMNNVGMIRLDY